MDSTAILFLILALIFLLSTCALGYACINMLKKIETYENWIDLFRSEIDSIYHRLKMVDDQNLFEKDDDVGFVFSEILRVTEEFNNTIK